MEKTNKADSLKPLGEKSVGRSKMRAEKKIDSIWHVEFYLQPVFFFFFLQFLH